MIEPKLLREPNLRLWHKVARRKSALNVVEKVNFSRQIQDLEKEIGFPLFERLPRGVKLSPAGKLFWEDARRILGEVQEATRRAERVASGKAGTVGFVESISWHGVVPEFFRRFKQKQPDAELTPVPRLTLAQVEAVQSGRLS